MLTNKIKINLSTLDFDSSATTVNIPINLEYQLVDQTELANRLFVDIETEKSINPIIDYEKVRFSPLDPSSENLTKINYIVNLDGATTLGEIGFTNDDIKFRKETFKQTFLRLSFFDTKNPLTQNLVATTTLFLNIKPSDLYPLGSIEGIAGQPKSVDVIPITFILENPEINIFGEPEGYFLYDYKDEVTGDTPKYLYMRASFNNAKNGKTSNMMVKNAILPIDELINEVYTRYKLIRMDNGFFYQIDETYNGDSDINNNPNNVIYSPSNNSVTINLYQIRAL